MGIKSVSNSQAEIWLKKLFQISVHFLANFIDLVSYLLLAKQKQTKKVVNKLRFDKKSLDSYIAVSDFLFKPFTDEKSRYHSRASVLSHHTTLVLNF